MNVMETLLGVVKDVVIKKEDFNVFAGMDMYSI